MEPPKTPSSQSNPETEQSWDIILPDFKLYYKAILTKVVWHRNKNKHTDQWNRLDSPEISPQIYGQLIINKGIKNIQRRNESLCNKWCWENSKATYWRVNLECYLILVKLQYQASSILNNLVLNQVVHRKNVLLVKQNLSSWPNNTFMLIVVCLKGKKML